jgi:hypothetical protein
MKIQHVNLEYVNQVWPKVEDYIKWALDYQTDYTIEHVKTFVTTGAWVLLVAVDDAGEVKGASVIQFFNRPNNRVAFVISMGGKLITNKETFQQFSDLLKAFGATAIEGAARESIARLWKRYGFEEKYRIVGVKL